jgi:hypothetical protein
MSRPKSPSLLSALSGLADGTYKTAKEAAKANNVLESTISRARKIKPKCTLCGK